jgi:phytoene dehydrogenase-like protein
MLALIVPLSDATSSLQCTAALAAVRAIIQVHVLEEKVMVGGACRTEFPFPKVPGLGQSTGAYLLGVMPPELKAELGLNIRTIRRDPHYFLPTFDRRHLLLGSDTEASKRQFLAFFSCADWDAGNQMNAELSLLREDLSPCWLQVRTLLRYESRGNVSFFAL